MTIEAMNAGGIHRTKDGRLMKLAEDGRHLFGTCSCTQYVEPVRTEITWRHADGEHHSRRWYSVGPDGQLTEAVDFGGNRAAMAAMYAPLAAEMLARARPLIIGPKAAIESGEQDATQAASEVPT